LFPFLFIFRKTLSNAKYEYAKILRKILLEDALAMIFIENLYLLQMVAEEKK